jgi:oligopeptidase A
MAACMLRLRCQKSACFASFKQLRNLYICLIPEIPDESPDQNPLLRPSESPKFQDVTIENCINSIGKLVTDFEGGLSRLEDSLLDKEAKTSFDSIIEPIERLSFPLTCAWSNVKTYATVKQSDRMTNVYQTLHPRVQKARSARFHSLPIYKALKEVKSTNPNLTEEQLRIVDKYLLEGRLNGIELSGYNRSHFWNVVTKLAEQKYFYRSISINNSLPCVLVTNNSCCILQDES